MSPLLHANIFFVFCLSASTVAQLVTLDSTTYFGTTLGFVTRYLGVPFAGPPTGDRRFRSPVAKNYSSRTFPAVFFGPSCPQQAVRLPNPSGIPADTLNATTDSIFRIPLPDVEDCLTVNVVKPALSPAGGRLPVVIWIYGGGFELGSTSAYDGGKIVQCSMDMGKPAVYVNTITVLGFLGSKEVKAARVGNLGLQDQRLALRCVQKYIDKFGGDHSKVTIWGESSGSVSVSLHMLTNGGDTEGLFRAAFMQSGFPIPVGDITNGQPSYDTIVRGTGCSSAPDTLACLRAADYETLCCLMNDSPDIFSYHSLHLAWLPRTDGVFLKETPQQLVASENVAENSDHGDCDDEGTLFSFANLNVTTEDQLRQYMKTNYIVGATDRNDSPPPAVSRKHHTRITIRYWYFQCTHSTIQTHCKFAGGHFLSRTTTTLYQQAGRKAGIWTYPYKRLKGRPFLGAAHGTDILNIYGIGEMQNYLINFATNLDPNGLFLFTWPKWNSQTRSILTFLDGFTPVTIPPDTFREDEPGPNQFHDPVGAQVSDLSKVFRGAHSY